MKPKQMLVILSKARALLAAGWCQVNDHVRVNGQDRYCAQAAISMAATGGVWSQFEGMDDLYVIPNALARERVPSLVYSASPVTYYNDMPGRTKEEVLALFDQAIAQLKSPPG